MKQESSYGCKTNYESPLQDIREERTQRINRTPMRLKSLQEPMEQRDPGHDLVMGGVVNIVVEVQVKATALGHEKVKISPVRAVT